MKTVVVLQSAYLPWKGYFHLLREADLFIFHDDLQFTHSDWRSRNRIVTPDGPAWLSVPAGRSEKRLICDVEIESPRWKKQHRRAFEQNYRKAPCYREFADLLDRLYANSITNLSQWNQRAIRLLAERLEITTALDDTRRFQLQGAKTERLIELLTRVDATCYLSGPAGRNYLDESRFVAAGIELKYFEYPAYPDYPQRFGVRCHEVTVLDLLFNVGDAAGEYIWGTPTRDERSMP